MLNKAEMKMLERVFEKEINGLMLQTKSKVAQKLEDKGYIQKVTTSFGSDALGKITASGYVTTIRGNATYCASCRDAQEERG